MRRNLLFAGLTAGMLLSTHVSAAGITITPELIDSSEPVIRALQENAGHASTTMTGKGAALHVTYGSADAIQVYMVALDAKGSFIPTDFMHFVLPASDHGDETIDLTVSPGWSFRETKYQLHMLTKTSNANATFYDAVFLPPTALSMITTPVSQILRPEPYTPSTYHTLYGYRALGISVVLVLGILALLVSAVLLALRGNRGARATVLALILLQMLYSLRVSVDLLRFTSQHLGEYYGTGSYDEAGYIYRLAADIKLKTDPATQSVYMCRDGTNFKEKLLRYFIYPIPVSAEPTMASGATLAVVSDKYKQGYTYDNGNLTCGALSSAAVKLASYPDGTQLFGLQHSIAHL